MTALLRQAQHFAARFAARKREDGVLDFHDLEQFALKLLWDFAADKPTPTAERWREKLRFVFVDEYQDINAAQDKIIQALSREDQVKAYGVRRHVAAFNDATYRVVPKRGHVRALQRQPLSCRRRETKHLPFPPGRPENFPRLRRNLARQGRARRFRSPKISAAANRC